MHVWVDGQCLQTASRVRGIGRYVTDFVRALAKHSPRIDLSISFNTALLNEAIAARGLIGDWINPRNIHTWQGVAEGGEANRGRTARRRLSEIAIAHHVACLNPDIALCASPFEGAEDPAVPLLLPFGHDIRLVSLFFDAIPFRFFDRYLKTRGHASYYVRRLRALRHSTALLAISEFAENEARELIPGPEVVRIDAGVSPDFLSLLDLPPDRAAISALGLSEPFILYVGGLDWRKNLIRVVQAFRLLPPDLSHRLQFAVVGDCIPLLQAEVMEAWLDQQLPADNLRILGYVSPEALVHLYKRCELVVQPSLMEGFGLTALEAMVCGTPVIAANSGALPEVVGNARALFDPNDPTDIAAKLKEVLTDKRFRAKLIDRGREQARTFSWERSANLAVQEFSRILAAAPGRSSESREGAGFAGMRQVTAKSIGALRKIELAAPILASAEPLLSHEPKLLIDVTSTCRRDPGTGIQRVVKQTAAALIAIRDADDPAVHLSYCDSSPGLWRVRFGSDPMKLEKCPTGTRLVPCPGDILLMLDSSWEFWPQHTRLFRNARLTGCDVYSTLYDTVPLKAPAFCGGAVSPIFSEWFRTAVTYSSGFVCISRTVADELLRLLEAVQHPRPVKVGYWHLGADFASGRTDLLAEAAECAEPMFLMVGTIEPRKGYRVALDAFSALWQEGFSGSLCIVGKNGWGTEQLVAEIRSHPEFGRKLRWIEGVSDGALQALYASCSALIAASYMEGFGLPLVEASYHCKPVIASDIPVFREVADAPNASFFQVGSTESLIAAVKDFTSKRRDLGPVTSPSGKRISWKESASQLKRVILGGSWYQIYEPRHHVHKVGQRTFAIGDATLREPLDGDARHHRLELVGKPTLEENGRSLKFTLKVSNLSNRAWSSAFGHDCRYGVALGYRLLTADDRVLADENSRTTIPFVLPPEDYHYLAVQIDIRRLNGAAHFIEFELLQEGVQWWGNPLRANLSDAKGFTTLARDRNGGRLGRDAKR